MNHEDWHKSTQVDEIDDNLQKSFQIDQVIVKTTKIDFRRQKLVQIDKTLVQINRNWSISTKIDSKLQKIDSNRQICNTSNKKEYILKQFYEDQYFEHTYCTYYR